VGEGAWIWKVERVFLGGGYEAMNLSVRFEERNKDVPVCDNVALLQYPYTHQLGQVEVHQTIAFCWNCGQCPQT
jgi:hypothetical protein